MKSLLSISLLTLAASCAIATGAHAALTDNLVAYYNFDGNVNNNALASGGSAYNGALSGDASTAGAGKFGSGSLTLDGTGDYMTVNSMVNLNSSWTISAWFQTTTVPTGSARQAVYESYANGSSGYGMSYGLRDGTSGNTNFQTFTDLTPGADASADFQVADASTANVWYQVTETYDTTTGLLTTYLNGVQTSALSLGANTFVAATNLRIGTYRSADGRYFTGNIDDVGVWSRALTTQEITSLQTSAVPEPSAYGLLGAGALAAVAFVRRRRKAV